jgi:hypothetical protein
LALAPVEDAGSARRFAGQETGPLALKRTTQSRTPTPPIRAASGREPPS